MEVLILLGVALRVALIQHTGLTTLIANRIEVSTPVTSYKRMQEGVFLFRNNIDPYDGGVFHQPPLLLALFHVLPEQIVPYFFIAVDVLCALMLVQIAKRRTFVRFHDKDDETTPLDSDLNPLFVAAAFLLNPLSLLTCLGKATLPLNSLCVIAAVFYATKGNRVLSLLFLSLASYMTLYPVMLVLPIAVLLSKKHGSHPIKTTLSCLSLMSVLLLSWLGISNLLMGSWNFIEATYGTLILVPDLTPNIGLSWYIFIEMFDQFRLFFLLVFQVFVVAFCVPLTVKFFDQPLFVVTLFCIITAAFKSYPSFGDIALYIPFVFIHQELFKYMKNLYLTTYLGLVACILLPLFYNLWIYAGSGNANFFYAITLVVGVGQVLLLGDLIGSMLRREWERGEGVVLRKKRVELIQK
ncbi:GPI transamidase subunit PIG-U [Obelidium mucronatum]|nr:GPI transamidase subunit PIG-U [Obelidium mucronatum]